MAIQLPSSKIWAFNPTYVVISGEGNAVEAEIAVGSNSISVPLRSGAARVLISRLVQLCFADPRSTTTASVNISVNVNGGSNSSMTATAVWGSMDYDDTADAVTVQRFVNFPQPTQSFQGATRVTYVDRHETEGCFLRWIDNHGDRQYYLFCEGKKAIKSKAANVNVEEFAQIEGTTFARYERPQSITTERTLKVCATSLDKQTLRYVQTIIGSPVVDKYDNGIWVPVNVADGTYDTSHHHLTEMQDLELAIELPSLISQQL